MHTLNFASRFDSGSSIKKTFGSPQLLLQEQLFAFALLIIRLALCRSLLALPFLRLACFFFCSLGFVSHSKESYIFIHIEIWIESITLKTIATSWSFGSRSFTIWSLIEICPSVTSSKPAIIRIVVVFPHPEGPRSTRNSLSGSPD